MAMSLTSLKDSVDTLSKKLVKQGFVCDVDKFIDDTRGCDLGGSYIELTVAKGDEAECFTYYPVYGYTQKNDFSGQDMKWSTMKSKTLEKIADAFHS